MSRCQEYSSYLWDNKCVTESVHGIIFILSVIRNTWRFVTSLLEFRAPVGALCYGWVCVTITTKTSYISQSLTKSENHKFGGSNSYLALQFVELLGNNATETHTWKLNPNHVALSLHETFHTTAYQVSNCSQVSCGMHHTLALTQSGDLYGWGFNHYGALLGTPGDEPFASKLDLGARMYVCDPSVPYLFDTDI